MRETHMDRPWQIRMVVDPVGERAYGLALEPVQRALEGKPPRKVIVVPGRLVNVVILTG